MTQNRLVRAVSYNMIKRLKTDAVFHLRKRPFIVAASCCCACVVLVLLIICAILGDLLYEDHARDAVLLKSNLKDKRAEERAEINVFIIVCKLKRGDQHSVVRKLVR